MEKQFLSRAETRQFLGISEFTLRRMEKDGQLPVPIIVGKSKRYDRDELIARLTQKVE